MFDNKSFQCTSEQINDRKQTIIDRNVVIGIKLRQSRGCVVLYS